MPSKGESCSLSQFVGSLYEEVGSLFSCCVFSDEGSSREVGRGEGLEGGEVGLMYVVSVEELRFEKGVKNW